MKQNLVILIFIVTTFSFAQNTALFEKGNALYNQGEYEEAIDV